MSLSRRVSTAVATGLVAVLALAGCTPGDVEPPAYVPPAQADGALPAEIVGQLQSAVENAMNVTGASGAIVGVWAPWAGSWVTALGTQKHGSSEPVTVDQSFRIAAVTRLMTCDVLYALDREGVLSKDDAVSRHVAGVPQLSNVTLLDLCNGTSGIGTYGPKIAPIVQVNPLREWGPLELATYGTAQLVDDGAISYRHSDAAYVLLGIAMERATREPVQDLFDRYVSQPLGLSNTELPGASAAVPAGDALPGSYMLPIEGGFDCTAPVDATLMSASSGYTYSGATSTVQDLGRYIRSMASQDLYGGSESTRWSSPLPRSTATPIWRQATGGAELIGPMIGFFGSVPGYATAAFSDPDSGFTVVVALNSSTRGDAPVARVSWELAAIASKVPAVDGYEMPDFALPFTADEQRQIVNTYQFTCVEPPAEEPAEGEESEEASE